MVSAPPSRCRSYPERRMTLAFDRTRFCSFLLTSLLLNSALATTPVAPPPETTTAATYLVQAGDTLSGISRQTGITVPELQRLNGLTTTALHVGQTLQLGARPSGSIGATTSAVCGPAVTAPLPPLPLPTTVSGKVSFYAAVYDPKTAAPVRAYAIGPVNRVMPLASAYKTAVLWATLRDVEAGRLKLSTRLATTEANRSIEFYSKGTNTVQHLLQAAIGDSENTAADVLHRTVGTERIASLVAERSPCTQIMLTNKALWGAQAGLFPELIPSTSHDVMLRAAQRYQALPLKERIAFASRLNTQSLQVTGPAVERSLDVYFKGPNYDAALDTALQNTSTAQSYADFLAYLHLKSGLSPQNDKLMRSLLGEGCCRDKAAPFKYTYWGAKAGSGWRLLTLTGAVQLPDGRLIAYAYLNHESNTLDSVDIERQIRPLMSWLGPVLYQLGR